MKVLKKHLDRFLLAALRQINFFIIFLKFLIFAQFVVVIEYFVVVVIGSFYNCKIDVKVK